MKLQIITKEKKVWLKLLEKDQIVAQKELENEHLSENLLCELDKLLKENKIEKRQLESVNAILEDEDSGSAKIARIISLAGSYCLTKEKKSLN